MTLVELVDVTERFLSNTGVATDESKWDALYLENLIHRYSRMAITQYYAQAKNINPIWAQRFDLVYDKDFQEGDCLVKFKVPSILILGNTQTGLIYFGNRTGICTFRFVKTRAELAMYGGHRFTNRSKIIRALYTEGVLEERNDTMLQNAFVDMVGLNPTDFPTFNRKSSQYPISEDLIPLMHQLMWKNEGQLLSLRPVDGNPNKVDDNNTRNTK